MSESTERIEGLREFQQSIDLVKKDEKYFAEPLIGLSSDVREAVFDEAGGIKNWKYCSPSRGV